MGKEGLYFGRELPPDHPRVRAGALLHGANLWPDLPGFREAVLAYLDDLTTLGHRLMSGLALGLGLDPRWFESHGTAEPLTLLRLFNYPSRRVPAGSDAQWGVGEHTDYGLLTILWQDDVGAPQCSRNDARDDSGRDRPSRIGHMPDNRNGYRKEPEDLAIPA